MVRDGYNWDYEGEQDKEGRACGYGVAKRQDRNDTYVGTWFNDAWEGLGKCEKLTVLVRVCPNIK